MSEGFLLHKREVACLAERWNKAVQVKPLAGCLASAAEAESREAKGWEEGCEKGGRVRPKGPWTS